MSHPINYLNYKAQTILSQMLIDGAVVLGEELNEKWKAYKKDKELEKEQKVEMINTLNEQNSILRQQLENQKKFMEIIKNRK